MYPLRGFSEDPNAGEDAYLGNAHKHAVIYAEHSDRSNFPVLGYLVGGKSSVWAYSGACSAPDFNLSSGAYLKLVSSPE